MSKELFSLRVCQLYNALCFGYTQGGAGVSKKRLRLSYLELRRNSDVALLNTENLRVRALAPHIYYSTEGNKEEGGWEGEREDDPVAAAEEPRVSSWDVLDMSSLDLIPKLLAAFTEIRLQPERRRLKQENIANSAGRETLTNLPDHSRIAGCAAKPDTCAVKCVDVQHVVPPARCSARTATLRPAQLRSLPGTTIHPLQSRGSWTSCRHELAAPVLLWADKVNYHPADPPAPSAMVATYTDQWSGRRLRQAA